MHYQFPPLQCSTAASAVSRGFRGIKRTALKESANLFHVPLDTLLFRPSIFMPPAPIGWGLNAGLSFRGVRLHVVKGVLAGLDDKGGERDIIVPDGIVYPFYQGEREADCLVLALFPVRLYLKGHFYHLLCTLNCIAYQEISMQCILQCKLHYVKIHIRNSVYTY